MTVDARKKATCALEEVKELVARTRAKERQATLAEVYRVLSADSKMISPEMSIRAMAVLKGHFK